MQKNPSEPEVPYFFVFKLHKHCSPVIVFSVRDKAKELHPGTVQDSQPEAHKQFDAREFRFCYKIIAFENCTKVSSEGKVNKHYSCNKVILKEWLERKEKGQNENVHYNTVQ